MILSEKSATFRDRALALGAQQPAALALPTALLLGFALVVQLLAAREPYLDLGAAFFIEVELERHQGHSLALDRPHELVDLGSVKEKLADALGGMIKTAALEIFRNIGIDEPYLPVAGIGIRFCDCRLALTQRLHFRPGESDAGL